MSHLGLRSARCSRNASRKRRLIRLRTTLPPMARGTVSPSLATDFALSGRSLSRARQNAANNGPETRVPWSYTLRKSAVRRALGEKEAEEDTEQMGAQSPARLAGFGVADGLLVAHSQLVTAAGPAAGQHGPSILRLHALAKSVYLGALAIIRLKSPFRHICLYSARNAPGVGASFDGIPCRRIQYNKRIASGLCSCFQHLLRFARKPLEHRNPRFRRTARFQHGPIRMAACRTAPPPLPPRRWARPGF